MTHALVKKLKLAVILIGIASVLLIGVLVVYFNDYFGGQQIELHSILELIKTTDSNHPYFLFGLAFLPAILTISYPFIIQIISKLNETYNSSHIVNQFYSEKYHKYFIRLLILSVSLTIASTIFHIRIILIINLIADISLMVIFFLYSDLLLVYQDGKKLFRQILGRYSLREDLRSNLNHEQAKYLKGIVIEKWDALTDLFIYSAQKSDTELNDEIYQGFIYPAYSIYSEYPDAQSSASTFPIKLYNTSRDVIYKLTRDSEINYYLRPTSFIIDLYLPNHNQYFSYSTYSAIWRHLTLIIESENEQLILAYWKSVEQFASSYQREPTIEFQNFEETSISKKRREVSKFQTSLFVQFNIVFCAYLFHKRNLTLLRKIWMYSSSYPPRYNLFPYNVRVILETYLLFRFDNYLRSSESFATTYYFNDLGFEEMNQPNDVMRVVRSYCVLLFLRLWKLQGNGKRGFQLSIPNMFESQIKNLELIDQLESFKKRLDDHLKDTKLLEGLNLNMFLDKYFSTQVINYIKQFQDRLRNQINERKITQPLDEEKINTLENYAKDILRKQVYDSIRRINGGDVSVQERDRISDSMQVIRGKKTYIDREAFVRDSTVGYIGFGEALVTGIRDEYLNHICIKFFSNKTVQYEVPFESLFEAIDKLMIEDNEFVIVSFNINYDYLLRDNSNLKQVDHNSSGDYSYKSIPIYNFKSWIPHIGQIIFVLKKKDLPMIRHKKREELYSIWNKDDLNHWKRMKELDAEMGLYFYIERGNNIDSTETDEPKIIIDIDFLGYCWFRKGVKIVAIKLGDAFQEGGIKDSVNEIDPF